MGFQPEKDGFLVDFMGFFSEKNIWILLGHF
jgi:hypothetical protein